MDFKKKSVELPLFIKDRWMDFKRVMVQGHEFELVIFDFYIYLMFVLINSFWPANSRWVAYFPTFFAALIDYLLMLLARRFFKTNLAKKA